MEYEIPIASGHAEGSSVLVCRMTFWILGFLPRKGVCVCLCICVYVCVCVCVCCRKCGWVRQCVKEIERTCLFTSQGVVFEKNNSSFCGCGAKHFARNTQMQHFTHNRLESAWIICWYVCKAASCARHACWLGMQAWLADFLQPANLAGNLNHLVFV